MKINSEIPGITFRMLYMSTFSVNTKFFPLPILKFSLSPTNALRIRSAPYPLTALFYRQIAELYRS